MMLKMMMPLTLLLLAAGSLLADDTAVLATIDGVPVYLSEALAALQALPEERRAALAQTPASREQFLDEYLEGRQALAEARAQGLDREPEYLLRERQLRDELLLTEFNRRLQEQVTPPTDTEVAAYYAANPDEFTRKPGVDIAYLIVRDTATAQKVKREWRAARDLPRLHARYAILPDSRATMPYRSLRPDLLAPLRAARVNAVTIAAADTGVMVIRKLAEIPEQRFPLAEVRNLAYRSAWRAKLAAYMVEYRRGLNERHPLVRMPR
ncbi:MAG TPA: peptidylprolyl isomerase [bacterium]|nr:peptidylprolyl isomerase [bacterium]